MIAEVGDDLLCDVRDHVAYITINREERRNALSTAIRARFPGLISELEVEDDVWVIVITGAGDRAFCAGADLKEVDEAGQQGQQIQTPMTGSHRNMFEAVLECAKPTIASINGFALAGGCELAMACDLRIASDDAQFGMPEAKLGMGANFATVLLPRLVPRAIALEMLYTGDRISAARALEIGLINRVVPKADLRNATEEYVRNIAANAPLTLSRYKEMTVKGWELPIQSALRLNVGPNPYQSEDRKEGVRAFFEKRAPQWRGR